MKRSKHSLSHYHLTTMNMGQLVPIATYEVLPGDSVQQATSALVRISPLQSPLMHPVVVRIHHWFVPHRLVWDDWEDFITGGPNGTGAASPYPAVISGGGAAGGLYDYFGCPPNVADLDISLLPMRSYNKIWNEFYRDQDLQAEVSLDSSATQYVSWEKDYFTSARPWPQKGPEVTIPLGTVAPVMGIGQVANNSYADNNLSVYDAATGLTTYPKSNIIDPGNIAKTYAVQGPASGVGNPQIFADLGNATAASVLELREAMAIQRYQEARARYGSRYTEYLRYLGVRSSDARLQRPEYLGGGKATIAFSEVLQTAPDVEAGESTSGVGDLFGHGISALRSRRFRRFFEEHGFVLSLMSVRPKTIYADALNRMFSRRTKEDYWQKELEHVGLQEVFQREVYASGPTTGGTDIFGYQDRYAEYRHIQSRISGDFRTIMSDWHMARIFGSAPVLNGSFIQCQPTERVYQDQTPDSHKVWVMANHSIQARRMVTKNASGRII